GVARGELVVLDGVLDGLLLQVLQRRLLHRGGGVDVPRPHPVWGQQRLVQQGGRRTGVPIGIKLRETRGRITWHAQGVLTPPQIPRSLPMLSVPMVSRHLQHLLTTTADAAGEETGCIQRTRRFRGATLCQTLVFGWLGAPA